jgi:hypothetical protein
MQRSLFGGLTLLGALCVATPSLVATQRRADTPSALPDVSQIVLRDVAGAEGEGATYPHPRADQAQPGFFGGAGYTGTADRKCIETKDGLSVLAGDILAGPFRMFQTHWQQGRTKIWWAPRYVPFADLIVRASRLDDPDQHTRFRFTDVASAIPSGVRFFPSDAWLPSAGRWMIVATAGSNWGCFVVNVQ